MAIALEEAQARLAELRLPRTPASLPLMLSKATPSTAHGRAPNSGVCWEQACPVGRTYCHNCQKSGSEK